MHTNPDPQARASIIRKIENHMAAKAINRKKLTEALGVSYHKLGRRMSGEIPFTTDEIWIIARTLRARPSDILPDDASMELGAVA